MTKEHIPLNKIIAHHELTPPSEYQPNGYDATLEGYTELVADLSETRRSLSGVFKVVVGGDRTQLEAWAGPHIDNINAERERAGQDTVPISEVSKHFLVGIAEPEYKKFMPADPNDEETVEQWKQFKDSFGNQVMARKLEHYYALHAKTDELAKDESLMRQWGEHLGERIKVVMAVTKWEQAHQDAEQYSGMIRDIRSMASQSGQPLTKLDHEDIKRLETLAQSIDYSIDPTVPRDEFLTELDRRDRQASKRELDSGLLMTDQMKQVIDESLPALLRGEPALFVGETGGAKTALAEYICKVGMGKEPELVSGYGDVNSYQLMGKQELREENGATVSEFMPGPIVRAMEQGRPLILDEINAMPAELLKRLNIIMQLRPGDTFTIQEDSGREVTVQPGFAIIATANEKSKRYKAVDDLSVEFQNRFGANIYRVRYPDAYASYTDPATENDRLAVATVVNEAGEFPTDIDPTDFDNFVKACFVSQQVFSGNHGEGFVDYLSTEHQLDNKPGLEETVLAPRTMTDILRKVAGSHGEISLKIACARFLDGIKNQDDKKVIANILAGHNLLGEDL